MLSVQPGVSSLTTGLPTRSFHAERGTGHYTTKIDELQVHPCRAVQRGLMPVAKATFVSWTRKADPC